MENMLNGKSQDEVDQKLHVKEDGIIAQLDDETLLMATIAAEESFEVPVCENGKDEKGVVPFSSSSSSSDDEEEVKAVLTEKTDESDLTDAGLDCKEEDGVLDLTVGEADEIVSSILCEELDVVEEVLEVESSPLSEELQVVEVIEEDTREVVDEAKKDEEESQVFITDDSPIVEAVAVELADVQSNQAEPEYVESQTVEAVAVELVDVQSNQAEPEYVVSQTVEAVAVELVDVQSNQAEPEYVESQTVEAGAMELADVQSNQAEPEYVESQIVKAVAVELANVQSNQAEPEYVESQLVKYDDTQTVETVGMELNDVHSNQVEYDEEEISTAVVEKAENAGTNRTLHNGKEESSYPTTAKFSNGTDDSYNKAEELPETDVNPIISISARNMQPTSWRGCCGLLEVFKRDR